jgi:hypothetical protein
MLSSKRPRYDDEDDEDEPQYEECPPQDSDISRIAELMRHTEALLELVERRQGKDQQPTTAQLSMQHSRQRERLIRIALQNWFSKNFSNGTARDIPRSKLMGFCNAYLSRVGLPQLNKQDPLWTDWFLKECVGLSDREQRLGKSVHLHDGRTLEGFASSLESLLKEVKREIKQPPLVV